MSHMGRQLKLCFTSFFDFVVVIVTLPTAIGAGDIFGVCSSTCGSTAEDPLKSTKLKFFRVDRNTNCLLRPCLFGTHGSHAAEY